MVSWEEMVSISNTNKVKNVKLDENQHRSERRGREICSPYFRIQLHVKYGKLSRIYSPSVHARIRIRIQKQNKLWSNYYIRWADIYLMVMILLSLGCNLCMIWFIDVTRMVTRSANEACRWAFGWYSVVCIWCLHMACHHKKKTTPFPFANSL